MNSIARYLLAGLLTPAATPVSAVPIMLSVGDSDRFQWSGGLGPIDSPADGYRIIVGSAPVAIDVTDGFITGDEFMVTFDDRAAPFSVTTGSVAAGIDTGATTFADAIADSRLSSASVVLGAGTWDIDISVVELAPNFSGGAGFIGARAAAVPEPGAWSLLGFGLLAFGFLRLRRMTAG